ncbi:MAG: hypothetical protein HOO96_15905 [Polyangiaceae bacterium]|nr:hypothetical protein [Polyangiaceae bacterium]
MNRFASVSMLAAFSLLGACAADTSADDVGEDDVTGTVIGTKLAGDWEGDIQLGAGSVDHSFLLVQPSGKVQVVGLARDSVLPDSTQVAGKVTGRVSAANVVLSGAAGSFTLALRPDGSLAGTAKFGTSSFPVSFARVAAPTSQSVKIVAPNCSGLKSLILGQDATAEAAANAKIDALVAANCKTITTTTPTETVTRKPFLLVSAGAHTKDFLSVKVVDADPATFVGRSLGAHTYDKTGAEIDLSKSFVATQAAYDKLLAVYVDENAFAFTGGEGSTGSGREGALAAARRSITFANGRISFAGILFSYAGAPADVNGFMIDDASNGTAGSLPFKAVASLGVLDAQSPVGKYVSANPQAVR